MDLSGDKLVTDLIDLCGTCLFQREEDFLERMTSSWFKNHVEPRGSFWVSSGFAHQGESYQKVVCK